MKRKSIAEIAHAETCKRHPSHYGWNEWSQLPPDRKAIYETFAKVVLRESRKRAKAK